VKGSAVHHVSVSVSHHAFHLPGAAGAVPDEARVVRLLVRHLGLVAVLVVQVVALLALHQLVAHGYRHLPGVTAKQRKEKRKRKNVSMNRFFVHNKSCTFSTVIIVERLSDF